MVGVAGFEPATPASRTQCSTGLSHTPTWNAAYSLGFRRPQAAELRKLITVNVGLKTQILPAGEAAVAAAARALAEGGLVAFPTETVYGLGADATNPAAIAHLYQAKGRPAFNPLIAHVGDIAAARAIELLLGRGLVQPPPEAESDGGQPLAPGMLASHYAPRARVRLNAQRLEPGEALLAFGLGAISGIDAASIVMNLSERGDLDEAAANLFGHLRALDSKGVRTIAVMSIPDEGLGEAVNDRLRRAAVGRE